ncbi:MAG: major capsid protein [bacterium]
MALLRAISPSDPVSRLALEGLEQFAPILQDVEFYQRPGASDNPKKAREGTVPTSIFRSLNEDNTATPPAPTYPAITKKIVSFDAKVDTLLEDRNEDPEAELAYQTRLEANEAAWILQEKVFEGDSGSDPEEFDGMRNVVAAGQILTTATNGLQIPTGNSDANVTAQQLAIEKLLNHISRVRGGATHLYANEDLINRLVTVGKNLGYYRTSIDEFGNQIERIRNVILRGAGMKKDGTLLLPFTETVGTSSDCSSIFMVRWGERVDLSALTSVGVKGKYAGQSGNFLINNVNLDMALVLQNDTALVQSKGWRL